jgi:Domain of unknown function (DUF222)/HNH endonuclease
MFECDEEAGAGPPGGRVDAVVVMGWAAALPRLAREVDDAERVDQLRALEVLKSAAEAAQAQIAVDLDASRRAAEAGEGVPAVRRGRGVAGEIGLARRESAHRGGIHLGLAKVLWAEMPHTRAAFQRGLISEYKARILVRETACLSLEHRRLIDAELAADPSVVEELGDRQLEAEIKRLAYELDPAAVVRRRSQAAEDRRVTLRPAPDTMALLSGLLPVEQGVAVYAALCRAADARIAAGDARTRGQLMADTLVERVTGQSAAEVVPVEVHLVMPAATLFDEAAGSDEPGLIPGFGPVPAGVARRLVVGAAEAERAWLRRLYTAPDSGQVVGMDSRRRLFPPGLARLIWVRDQYCRTPWCDAPVRHIDHALPYHAGGATSEANGQGLCAQCNHNRQAPGWQARRRPGDRHTLEVVSPTGHRYTSTAPRPPGRPRQPLRGATSRPSRGRRTGSRECQL